MRCYPLKAPDSDRGKTHATVTLHSEGDKMTI
jgi:hypothetical protein